MNVAMMTARQDDGSARRERMLCELQELLSGMNPREHKELLEHVKELRAERKAMEDHPIKWSAARRLRYNTDRIDEVIRSLGLDREAASQRERAVAELSPTERVRFLRGTIGMIRELLVEAEWRMEAIRQIQSDMSPEGEDPDELVLAVDSVGCILESFANYALLGQGQEHEYVVVEDQYLQLTSEAFAEIEARLARHRKEAPAR